MPVSIAISRISPLESNPTSHPQHTTDARTDYHWLRSATGFASFGEPCDPSGCLPQLPSLESRLSNPTPHHIHNPQPMPAQITIGFVSPRASLRSGNRALPRHARLPCLPGEPSPLCDVDSCKSISSGDDFPQTRIAKEHQGATTHHHHRKSARKRPANLESVSVRFHLLKQSGHQMTFASANALKSALKKSIGPRATATDFASPYFPPWLS